MQIDLYNQQRSLSLHKHLAKIQAAIHFVLDQENAVCDEMSIYFVTDAKMRRIHKDFFNDDSSTDCMSFPVDNPNQQGHCYLGDIFVCPDVALKYARPYEEVLLYALHGLLHLLGYDDIAPSDRVQMRRTEKKYMNHFRNMGLVFDATF